MIFRYILCVAIIANAIALTESMAVENVPDVSKGAQQFHQLYEVGGIQNLITQIRKCWAEFEVKKTQGAAARCFSLDYTSNLFDDFMAKKGNVSGTDFLRIEKVLTRVNRALVAIKIEQKERGMLIADWVRVSESEAARLAKQTGPNLISNRENFDKELFRKARSAILQILSGQESAKFTNFERVIVPNQKGVATEVICGKVDVKNSHGNYVGLRSFVYFVGDGTAYYDNRSDDPLDINTEVVKNFCAS